MREWSRLLGVMTVVLLLSAAAGGCTPPASSDLRVYFLDVGQGDSILLVALDGSTTLIDGGNDDGRALSQLERLAVTRLDLVIATHPHSDHIGGLVQILAALPVGEVITNGVSHTTSTYEDLLDAIASSGAPYHEVKQGDEIPFGSSHFDVLNPAAAGALGDLNETSLVLRYEYQGVAFLFTGDVGFDTEDRMMGAGLHLDADILKVAHHGSCGSTSASFLDAVAPLEAIICVGENGYGHPCQATIDRIEDPWAHLWTTKEDGTILVVVDSIFGYTISSMSASEAGETLTACRCVEASGVHIDSIYYDGLVRTTEADEYVQITNSGTAPVCMEGWRLVDTSDGSPSLVFPAYTLEPGASLRVYTNETHPESGGFSFGSGKAVWNNSDPDTAALYDCAGREVSRRSY